MATMCAKDVEHLLNREAIPAILFERIEQLRTVFLQKLPPERLANLIHLTDLRSAYEYIYYAMLTDFFIRDVKDELVVDWGGFVGQVTMLMNQLGYRCDNYVMELPHPLVRAVLDEHKDLFSVPFKLKQGPLEKFSYPDASCGAVISSGVLEHVREEGVTEESCLKEINRILKPGGYFVCWNLPRRWALLELVNIGRGLSHHEFRFTQKKITRLLQEHGFELVYFNTHGDILKMTSFLRERAYADGPWQGFVRDYRVSRWPLVRCFSHHITFIAKKL